MLTEGEFAFLLGLSLKIMRPRMLLTLMSSSYARVDFTDASVKISPNSSG
jgi:hypothetical protein